MIQQPSAEVNQGSDHMKPVRFGLIGYGAWGSHHARAIAKTAGAELTGIVARSPQSQAAAKEAFPDIDVYANYHQLLREAELDLVDVVVPSHLHHEIAAAVLDSGRHLLLEKPMALSLADCDDLIQRAEKQKKLLAVGHELRLSSMWGKVKQMVDAGAVGEPKYVLVELSRRPYRLGADGWRFDIDRVGNWILEEPIHFFDLARWYLSSLGDPVSVYARANSRQPDHPELQDNFSAILNFPGGGYAVIAQTLAAFEHHQTVKLTGTSGALWASWSGAMDRTLHPTFWLKYFDGQDVVEIPFDRMTGEVFELEDEMAMLVAAIRDGKPLACTGADGRWSVALCLAAQRSVDSGQPVTLSDLAKKTP
jgi:myo-inositol 2-dehydrogenase/D-chiro-inositol 1-dehydrogenase